MENHKTPDRPEVVAAVGGQVGADACRSESLAVEYRYVAMPVRRGGEAAGAVRVATPILAVVETRPGGRLNRSRNKNVVTPERRDFLQNKVGRRLPH